MVFFLALTSIFLVVSGAVAEQVPGEIASIDSIKIDDVFALGDEVAINAGESITVKVLFTALETAADVKVKIELEGSKIDVEDVTVPFNIEEGKKYSKTLTLKIPYELQDEVSEDLTLDIKIWNGDLRTEDNTIRLRVQRPSYNIAIMSIGSMQNVEAGQLLPVDIVLKNNGYNNLDDLYITAKIVALNIETTSFFGDLASVEDDDNDDTETRRVYLQVPYGAEAGLYALEIEAFNSDISVGKSKQIAVENEFSNNIVTTTLKKNVAVGDDGNFELIIANPTNNLRVFKIETQSSEEIATSSNVELVAIPAGTSKTVLITAHPYSKGEHTFDVSLFAGNEFVDSVTLSVYADGRSTNSAVALTIILVIIFLVLIGVLFVLLRKKSDKPEEFGESYY